MVKNSIFWIALAICCMPFMSPPYALFLGLILSMFITNPLGKKRGKFTAFLLKVSIVGLGFGININTALEAGKEGFIYTVISIISTLLVGILLGSIFKVDKITAYLVSSGTAICGGSAIAATAPVASAKEEQISVALGVVFVLNAIALFIFPVIGHMLDLSQMQFGIWSAIAIHDTSSVVGAASTYGEEALQIATTIKLVRALWIIPLVVVTAFIFKKKDTKLNIPYFIGLFVLAMLISSWVPQIELVTPYIVKAAKTGFTVTLFLIGSGLSPKAIKAVGFRPLLQGIVLWLLVSAVALLAVLYVI
ncbi:MAG: putative sulfate exporter family transporter [Chitinophagales bacterium]|nr:putative sulfate exporter family transporter [Chitinophagales bacterium]